MYVRFNKHMKNLVRNASQPEMHLANSAAHDAGATFIKLTSAAKFDFETAFLHNCVLSVPRATTTQRLTIEILGDLRLMGCDADCLSVNSFAVAHIMGVHFRADEWLTGTRCGSVITCVMDSQSLYARVTDFVMVDGDDSPGYAIVKWFSKPKYPYGTWLIPVVTLDGSDIEDQYGCVVRITDIDPSQISVDRNSTNDTFHMMRESGYDTCTLTKFF